MNPSRYLLPQRCARDRQEARRATLAWQRARFRWDHESRAALEGDDWGRPFRVVPGGVLDLPPEADFTPAKKLRLAASKLWVRANRAMVKARAWGPGGAPGLRAFESYYRLVKGPEFVVRRWRDDAEFARQRLTGVNPMSIAACAEAPPAAVTAAADAFLRDRTSARVDDLRRAGRLFHCDYPELASPRIQAHVKRASGSTLGAPTTWFWVDDDGRLMPLAIAPRGARAGGAVLTPGHPAEAWLYARTHAQAADAHLHEGYYHLVETHMVNEAVAVAMHRQLHPDHPVRQLLEAHYEGNLAINETARGHLLAPGGPIDVAMAAGVVGVLDAARMRFAGWSWGERALRADLASRGVGPGSALRDYHYRDDALAVHEAIEHFVRAAMAPWYRRDEDVTGDFELQAWLAEVASDEGGRVPGFPARVETVDALCGLLAELVFRAGPQHAAVNNGQFDAYGWIPNTPGMMRGPLPDAEGFTADEAAFWRAMPLADSALAQMNMVWILSAPTERSLIEAGEAPAFAPAVSFAAAEAVAAFRRRLQAISTTIDRRNRGLDVPYRYLDPLNISRSTDI